MATKISLRTVLRTGSVAAVCDRRKTALIERRYSVDEFGERFPRVGAGDPSGTDCLPARTANLGLMDLNPVGIRGRSQNKTSKAKSFCQ